MANVSELNYRESVEQFWINRRCYLHYTIESDRPDHKQKFDSLKDRFKELNITQKQAGDIEDEILGLVGDAIDYAYRNGFQEGIKFVLQNLKTA